MLEQGCTYMLALRLNLYVAQASAHLMWYCAYLFEHMLVDVAKLTNVTQIWILVVADKGRTCSPHNQDSFHVIHPSCLTSLVQAGSQGAMKAYTVLDQLAAIAACICISTVTSLTAKHLCMVLSSHSAASKHAVSPNTSTCTPCCRNSLIARPLE